MNHPILSILRESTTPIRVHLIGVAGSGMSGLAWLFLALGHRVSGSDKVRTLETDRLVAAGLVFSTPHTERCVEGADMVVYSSAVKPGNPAYDEAVRQGIPLVRRAEALATLMAIRKGIVVCGTHGKTTTSSLAAWVLRHAGEKPSHYVGAEIPVLGSNAHWEKSGEWFVAEGDESDGTLALFHPEISIVLNIEAEHLDFYQNLGEIEAVFLQLLEQTKGLVIYCGDDPVAERLCSARPRALSYGQGVTCDVRGEIIAIAPTHSEFRVWRGNDLLGDIRLGIPGAHNVTNALAVVALALHIGVDFSRIVAAMELFRGAKRRFDVKFRDERFTVVDDYGHHPTELRATLRTAKGLNPSRLLVVFQPHRYSRTQLLKEEFGKAFDDTDHVFITDVYAASEKPLPGVDGTTIVEAMKAHGHPGAYSTPTKREALWKIGQMVRPGDVVLTLGAGDVHEVGTRLAEALAFHSGALACLGEDSRNVARLYEPMASHTTLRVGGPAKFWYEPATEEELVSLVRYSRARHVPVRVLGRGSNLLVRDGGIAGMVICPDRGVFLETAVEGNVIRAGCGVKLKKLAALAKSAALGGFEWMEGIPGNVGGSIRMNAGAMGVETFDQVIRVRFLDEDGVIREKTKEEIDTHYRNVPEFITRIVLSVEFCGSPAPVEEIEAKLLASQQKRKVTQPIAASAGCAFKNPAGCPAGRLVDELGLKNEHVGGARVSDVHGNFIVNDGGATAADVLALIERIKERARMERGIELETEVQIIGEEHFPW